MEFWYENEVIKESGFFTNDIKDGEWEGYYEMEIKNLLEISIMARKMVTGFNGMMIL